MEKQTKNIITREWVEKELRFFNRANTKTAILWGVAFSLLCIPVTIGIVSSVLKEFNNIIIELILCVLMGGVFISPVAAMVFTLIKELMEKKRIDRGEFEISVRELLYKEEKYERRGRSHQTKKVLHFSDFDDVTSGGSIYQLASSDDIFYLVHYRGKHEVKLFYPEKMYEYKES